MHPENTFPAPDVGEIHDHLPIEATRPQKRGIEHVRPVGSRQQNHTLVRLKAVHLDQERVQRLLALVVAATQASSPVPAYRIDLIDEDDAGSLRLPLLEEVPNPGSAHTDEHLDEVRTRHLEERPGRFSGDGPREEGLARPRRAHQEDALGQTTAEPREPLRVLEELDDLHEFIFGLIRTGDVRERHPGRFGGDQLRLGPSELKRSIAPTLEGPQNPDPERDEQNPG